VYDNAISIQKFYKYQLNTEGKRNSSTENCIDAVTTKTW